GFGWLLMTHHVQFPPYLPRGKIDGKPHPVDPAERSALGQTVPRIEHHVPAVVQRILRSNSALEWQCFPAALLSLKGRVHHRETSSTQSDVAACHTRMEKSNTTSSLP